MNKHFLWMHEWIFLAFFFFVVKRFVFARVRGGVLGITVSGRNVNAQRVEMLGTVPGDTDSVSCVSLWWCHYCRMAVARPR